MQDTAPSPAPSRSGPYYGPDATAIATAAQRADADAASASEAEKSQDAVMGPVIGNVVFESCCERISMKISAAGSYRQLD